MSTAVAMPAPVFELRRAWAEIAERAPLLAETMTVYLDDLCQRFAPASVAAAETCLRQFALRVIATDSSCRAARDVSAIHPGSWCVALSARWSSARKRAVTARTINYKLGVLQRFFEHICRSGYPDAPAELPIFRPARTPRRPKAKKASKPPTPSRAVPPETTWAETAVRAPQTVATMRAYVLR
jgi:hypothetical protein